MWASFPGCFDVVHFLDETDTFSLFDGSDHEGGNVSAHTVRLVSIHHVHVMFF